MEETTITQAMLSVMETPGFFVKDRKITYANDPARKLLVPMDAEIMPLLRTGQDEYRSFIGGCLYLLLNIAGKDYEASVMQLDGQHLFLIRQTNHNSELQTLALAAIQLRKPLAQAMLASEQITPSDENRQFICSVNKSLNQLLRIIGNMSDAAEILQHRPVVRTCNVRQFFQEVLEKTQTLLATSGVHLEYSLPLHDSYCQLDDHMIERAIFNLISNAGKYAAANTPIHVSAIRKGRLYYFTVTANADANLPLPQNMFNQYLRRPGIEDSRKGLGLGLMLTHAAASAHGGTVLVEKLPEQKIRVTMTFEGDTSSNIPLHSPVLHVSSYGELDQALIELSDLLDSQNYI